MAGEDGEGSSRVRGRMVARASDAPSRDALREILRGDANRALDRALPAPGNGHTHEEQGGGSALRMPNALRNHAT